MSFLNISKSPRFKSIYYSYSVIIFCNSREKALKCISLSLSLPRNSFHHKWTTNWHIVFIYMLYFYLTRNYTSDNVNIIDQSYLWGKIYISFHMKARKVIKFGLVKALLEVPSQPEICFCGSKRDWWMWHKIILNHKCWISKPLTRIYCWVYKVNVGVKLEASW